MFASVDNRQSSILVLYYLYTYRRLFCTHKNKGGIRVTEKTLPVVGVSRKVVNGKSTTGWLSSVSHSISVRTFIHNLRRALIFNLPVDVVSLFSFGGCRFTMFNRPMRDNKARAMDWWWENQSRLILNNKFEYLL